MNSMKADGTYNKIGEIHRAAGVHSGPSFFPWHREFLKRVEFVLRQYNPTVALPIWDSTLDSHLPTPADSIFFTRHLVGEANANGDVYDTQFVNFLTMDVSFGMWVFCCCCWIASIFELDNGFFAGPTDVQSAFWRAARRRNDQRESN